MKCTSGALNYKPGIYHEFKKKQWVKATVTAGEQSRSHHVFVPLGIDCFSRTWPLCFGNFCFTTSYLTFITES